ncbi:Uncharacterised protein [Chlamydia trachomatis]|nr:Uncharacterised protein [Chlamydia trachomatis]
MKKIDQLDTNTSLFMDHRTVGAVKRFKVLIEERRKMNG